MKRMLIASVALVGFTAGSAFAADLPEQPAPVVVEAAPVWNWSGPYIGAQIGYGWARDRNKSNIPDYVEVDPDGILGGAFLGYNYQFLNNIVLGAEFDLAYSGIEGEGINAFGSTDTVELNWMGALRGRVGYAFDRILPYVAGGLAFSKVEHDGLFLAGPAGGKETAIGWTIGPGAEYAFTDNWIGRVEYRFTDLGKTDFEDGSIIDDLKVHEVRIGISYKF